MASIFFDGSTHYLSLTNTSSSLVPGTGDFTVEAWVYLNDYSSINSILSKADSSDTNSTGSWYVGVGTSTRLVFGQSSTDYFTSTGPVVPLKTWSHVAVVRQSGTMTVWLNGTTSASQSITTDLNGTGQTRVGRGRYTSSNYFSGYISNLRFVNGTAVYTSSFTPATSNLTAISGTQLLMATVMESTTITDYSANAWSFTKNGTGFVSTASKDPFATVTVDSLSLSQATGFVEFMSPTALKTIYVANDDALLNPSVVYNEKSYQEVYS